MRNREQRLRWIEQLIGTRFQGDEHRSALVIPTSNGPLALAFDTIVEVVPARRMRPFALLPEEYCGVLHRGNELAPIIDTGFAGEAPAHIVLVQSEGCLLGLRFCGAPSVVDLDETDHTTLTIERWQTLPQETLPLLDVDAAVAALLALD